MAEVIRESRPRSISSDEWKVRVDLAACYRLFVEYGWTDLVFTHCSARVPGHPDQYLINPYGLMFEEITASSLIKVDFSGNVIWGDYPVNSAGHAIHSAVLQAREDANIVLHSHTRAGIAVSTMQCGLLPISQHACEVLGDVAYHEYDLAIAGSEECHKLGEDLGDRHCLILNNHGLLSCGRDVPEAFLLMYNVEIACKVQVDALASGQSLHYIKKSAADLLSEYGRINHEKTNHQAQLVWPSLIRRLDTKDTSYST